MVTLTEGNFDVHTDKTTGKTTPVKSYTWQNGSNVSVKVINYGATVVSIKVPGKNGQIDDVVLGFDDLKGYQTPNNPYFGATVGRNANRIGFGRIAYLGGTLEVSKNLLGKHQLHGGFKGFDKVMWEPYIEGTKLVLSYRSADGEEGYPGDVLVHTTFELTDSNELLIDIKATTTKPTVVNLTNHSYFNLAGHEKGAVELYKHEVSLNADRITETDNDRVSTGVLLPVATTVFDLRIPKILGDVLEQVPNTPGNPGYDHNFVITKGPEQGDTFVARVVHPVSGRVLEVYSNQPGVQLYTANNIAEDPKKFKGDPAQLKNVVGKNGARYYRQGAFCLETQNWPDAPNHTNFPKAILNPGELYHHTVAYKFSVQN